MDDGIEQPQSFRPEVFFLGRTDGWGVFHGPTGRIQRRCSITTEGRLDDAREAIHFDERFTWDNGESEDWRWVMRRGLDGRYVGAEALIGPGIEGRYDGVDYLLSFRRPIRENGGPRPRFVTRFSQISSNVALKLVKISMFGLPVASMTAFHRRAD